MLFCHYETATCTELLITNSEYHVGSCNYMVLEIYIHYSLYIETQANTCTTVTAGEKPGYIT